MAGGGGGVQAPSFLDAITSFSATEHMNDLRLFLNSNGSGLSTYDSNINSDKHDIRIPHHHLNTFSAVTEDLQNEDNVLATSQQPSKGLKDETPRNTFINNKKRSESKKKSTNSTISSNTSSSYSSSSGVESMTTGNPVESNAMSDKDKYHDAEAAAANSKETMYAVGQWLRFLQMDGYLQVNEMFLINTTYISIWNKK